MEVKPGYKQTEVGVIPDEWEAARLGDKTTKVGSGITPTGGARVYKQEGRPFLRSQNVGWGNLLLDDMAFIDDDTHATFQDTEIEADDVFLNITGASIGRSALADARVQRGNVNQHVCIIRTNQVELHPRFLNYFLLSTAGQKQIDSFQAGGNRQGLNFGQVRSFRLPLPLPPEQRAIAGALSDVDALIGALDSALAKKRDLKQAAMQHLLTGQKRLPGFHGEWEVKTLKDVCHSISDGTHFTPQYVETGIPFYSVENVTANNFADTKFISVKEHNQLIKRCKPEKGDILLTRIGAIGDTKLIDWDVEASIYVSLALLKVKDGVDLRYLYCYTKCRRFILDIEERSLMNASPKKINMGEIGGVPIPLPELAEQTAIAEVLSDMDAELAALEQRRGKTRALKQGIMQELLTGRTRLV